jgi:FkbM family methyltransferase
MPFWKSKVRNDVIKLGVGVLRVLPWRFSVALLTTACRRLGIDYIGLDTPQGPVLGSPNDYSLFGQFMRDRDYSPGLVKVLKDGFAGNYRGTFIDIGANIGLVTIPLAKLGIHCEVFEPEPLVYRLLSWNLAFAGVEDKVTAYHFGLFDKDTTLTLSRNPWNYGDNRLNLEKSGDADQCLTEVPLHRLDDIIDPSTIKQPLVVKIDIQGAEFRMLEGGRQVLSQAQVIVMEFWPGGGRRLGSELQPFLDFVADNFRYGNVLSPLDEVQETVAYTPVAELVKTLQRIWDQADEEKYFDVVLKK